MAGERSWRLGGPRRELVITRLDADGVEVIELVGHLDVASHQQLRELAGSSEQPGGSVVLDLSGVGFLDSSGLGAIAVVNRWVSAGGGSLRLVADDRAVLRLLAITGLDQSVAVHRDRDEAVAAAR